MNIYHPLSNIEHGGFEEKLTARHPKEDLLRKINKLKNYSEKIKEHIWDLEQKNDYLKDQILDLEATNKSQQLDLKAHEEFSTQTSEACRQIFNAFCELVCRLEEEGKKETPYVKQVIEDALHWYSRASSGPLSQQYKGFIGW